MQSQIKVSVALMNKRVQPICAAAETERFYSMSERKKKRSQHIGWWFGHRSAAALSPRGTPSQRPCHLSWQPVAESIACENTWKRPFWFNKVIMTFKKREKSSVWADWVVKVHIGATASHLTPYMPESSVKFSAVWAFGNGHIPQRAVQSSTIYPMLR